MPRPPRIQYPHAWYHVMNRVTCRKTLYFSEHHYAIFITLLEMASKKHNVAVHSYCLMKNHYHLLLCTPEGNISKFMQYFSSQFVTIINKHNHRVTSRLTYRLQRRAQRHPEGKVQQRRQILKMMRILSERKYMQGGGS